MTNDENDWVKNEWIMIEVEGVKPRGRPKKTWSCGKRLSDMTPTQGRCYPHRQTE